VVAYNADTGLACLYHYNTIVSFDHEAVEDADGNVVEDENGNQMQQLVPNEDSITQARELVAGPVGGNPIFHIVLGGLWQDGGDFEPEVKAAFVGMLIEVFQPATRNAEGHTQAHWNAPILQGLQ
jgi:hypothetical protein